MGDFYLVMLTWEMDYYLRELTAISARANHDLPQYVFDHMKETRKLLDRIRKEIDDASKSDTTRNQDS